MSLIDPCEILKIGIIETETTDTSVLIVANTISL